MWALIPQILAWAGTASLGWFANDIATPDTLSPEAAQAQKRKQQIRMVLLLLVVVGVIGIVYNKWKEHKKQSGNGGGTRKV
jgi:hypothetical protein